MTESTTNSYFQSLDASILSPPKISKTNENSALNEDEKIKTANQEKGQTDSSQTNIVKEPLAQLSTCESKKEDNKSILIDDDDDSDDEVIFLCSSPGFDPKPKASSPENCEKQGTNGKRPPEIELNATPVKKLHAAASEANASASDSEKKELSLDGNETKPKYVKPRILKSFWGPCISVTKVLAIDCEMAKVEGNALEVIRCSIVNSDGHVVFDHMMKPQNKVIDYVTWVHGILPSQVENCYSLEHYQEKILKILKNKIIVGHSLKVDFQVIGFQPEARNIRDLAQYAPMRANNCPMSLKNLVAKYLHADIQKGFHNSVEDARAAMALYRRFENQWEQRLQEINRT